MGIPVGQMDYLQADNEMNTFARMTGGRAYFPRFDGELPGIFNSIAGDIRMEVGRRIVLKYLPRFEYVLDRSAARGARVLQVLDELEHPRPEGEGTK